MSYASASAIMAEARAAWRPRRFQRVSEWAEAHRRLSSRTSAKPGAWSNDATPYLAEVMDAFIDPAAARIVVMKCSQVGATESLTNMIGWAVEHDPAPMMYVLPNEKVARDVCRERVLPAVKDSPSWRERLGTEVEDEAGLRLNFDRCTLHFAGAGSKINIRSKPCKRVFADDFDLCEPGTAEELSQRVVTFGAGGKVVLAGTPGFEGAGVHAEYEASDRRRYFVPCPHCHAYQTLRFERLRWDGGVKARPDDAARSTRYVCESCRGVILEHHKRGMLARGVWVCDGNHVEVVDGVPRQAGPVKAGAVRGYCINGELSPFVPWAALVHEFVRARGYPGSDWWNGKLGRPTRTVKEKVDISDVERMCVKVADGGHLHGFVPPWALWLSAAVDVQGDRLWVQVDAWGAGMERSALVAFFQVGSRLQSNLAELQPWLDRGWPVWTPDRAGKVKLRPWAWFIDSGWRTTEVYDFVRRWCVWGRRFVLATKGDGGASPREFNPEAIDRYPDGSKMEGLVQLLSINSRIWKDAVLGQVRAAGKHPEETKEPGIEAGMDAGMDAVEAMLGAATPLAGSRRVLPEDTPMVYMRHLTAEHLVERTERGQRVGRWVLKEGRTDNHGLDTTYVNVAGAVYLGGRSITEAQRAKLLARLAVGGAAPGNATNHEAKTTTPKPRNGPETRGAPASSLQTLYG